MLYYLRRHEDSSPILHRTHVTIPRNYSFRMVFLDIGLEAIIIKFRTGS